MEPSLVKSTTRHQSLWLLGGLALGFAIPSIFAGILQLPRDFFLIAYVITMGTFLSAYIRQNHIKLSAILRHKLVWGLVASVPLSFYAAQSVLIQPSSQAPQDAELAFDIVWSGIVYGGLDGIFLSVFPVYAMWQMLTTKNWTSSGFKKKVAAGAFALAASLLMIAVYHLGYPELQGVQVITVVLGVGVMSLAYIVTGNPTVAIISHIVMHIVAVLHGAESVAQLPPHY
jgi:hypothetical protein